MCFGKYMEDTLVCNECKVARSCYKKTFNTYPKKAVYKKQRTFIMDGWRD